MPGWRDAELPGCRVAGLSSCQFAELYSIAKKKKSVLNIYIAFFIQLGIIFAFQFALSRITLTVTESLKL